MREYVIQRLNMDSSYPTLGEIQDTLIKTLELPWRNNARGISCIPTGLYLAHRYHSPKRGYDVFLLENVPNRSEIEIHVGNSIFDTDGCILLGMEFDGPHFIMRSIEAFDFWMTQENPGEDIISLNINDP